MPVAGSLCRIGLPGAPVRHSPSSFTAHQSAVLRCARMEVEAFSASITAPCFSPHSFIECALHFLVLERVYRVRGAAFGLFPPSRGSCSGRSRALSTLSSRDRPVRDHQELRQGHLTQDRRLQALLIAFAFGGFRIVKVPRDSAPPVAIRRGDASLKFYGFSRRSTRARSESVRTPHPSPSARSARPKLVYARWCHEPARFTPLSSEVGRCAPVFAIHPATIW